MWRSFGTRKIMSTDVFVLLVMFVQNQNWLHVFFPPRVIKKTTMIAVCFIIWRTAVSTSHDELHGNNQVDLMNKHRCCCCCWQCTRTISASNWTFWPIKTKPVCGLLWLTELQITVFFVCVCVYLFYTLR